ncbi:pyridoxamine 5'-phosphate oxidase family protein [Paenibacillus sp. P96]|uniref:Pyridoxamine 5'-phosphate oxidase family protein n=1 Tax=Paenibacillus zeirhizosphaerae TaxID=2987519 RepID=A0ABT9FUR2_9BACL|nr:pyridoxamine 5'-phosphate oxidase family protein [Paenibacillus sp. P96]MDP4098474.1 pyridoxamine 5'-phosphate oxidase family protein [Paenibacillus sp. P96]
MRRDEFTVTEEEEISRFLDGMSFGFLGTVDPEGRPRVTPLNFVYEDGMFYFHGSYAGEKMKHLRGSDAVSFTVADEYALIPSYFSDPEMACPATSYFKSVTASGRAEAVSDLEEKARIFTRFMSKLQPEGGYAPIDSRDERYRVALKAVSLTRIVPDAITAKFKFGQNLEQSPRESLIKQLEERGQNRDQETADLMRKYCPYHQ